MAYALKLFPRYLYWHYSVAFADIGGIARNSLEFLYNFFSINVLLKTLFSPWERMGDRYKKGFNPEDFFATLVVNTMMRCVGAVMRIFLIVFGLASLVIDIGLIIVSFIVWTVLPLFIPVFFVAGVINLFN